MNGKTSAREALERLQIRYKQAMNLDNTHEQRRKLIDIIEMALAEVGIEPTYARAIDQRDCLDCGLVGHSGRCVT
jgi:hypothetical protein